MLLFSSSRAEQWHPARNSVVLTLQCLERLFLSIKQSDSERSATKNTQASFKARKQEEKSRDQSSWGHWRCSDVTQLEEPSENAQSEVKRGSCRELVETQSPALPWSAFLQLFIPALLRFQQDGSNSSLFTELSCSTSGGAISPSLSLTAGTLSLLSPPLVPGQLFLHSEQQLAHQSCLINVCGGRCAQITSLHSHTQGILWSCCPARSLSHSECTEQPLSEHDSWALLPSSEDVQAEQIACDPRPITAGNLD